MCKDAIGEGLRKWEEAAAFIFFSETSAYAAEIGLTLHFSS